MECYDLELSPSFEKVTVNIQYKNIKNVHLKVFRNLNVVLSVPLEITDDWVISFLLANQVGSKNNYKSTRVQVGTTT